jgi:uncharacterized damage-inducible protein DinB
MKGWLAMDPGIRFADLLAYNADETSHWKRWFADHPTALDLACDVAGAGTVRQLMIHVFTTELFFANHVQGLPRVDFEQLVGGTLDELFAINEEAHRKFQEFLERATNEDWAQVVPLGFRDFKASRRKMVMQAMVHSIHHRGQLATFLRQQGFKTWTHDFLMSSVIE